MLYFIKKHFGHFAGAPFCFRGFITGEMFLDGLREEFHPAREVFFIDRQRRWPYAFYPVAARWVG